MRKARLAPAAGLLCIAVAIVLPLLRRSVADVSAQSVPQFMSRIDLVEVAAMVTDANERPVAGLTIDDFQVQEDGKPVEVSAFIEIDSDRSSGPNDGRFLVLLLDDVHPILLARIRQVAHMFVDRMGRRDVVAVLSLNGSHHPTTDQREVATKQIDEFKAYTPGMMPSNAGGICPECGAAQRMGPTGGAAARSVGHALSMIASLSDQLAQVQHRRKTLVFVGDPTLFGAALERAHPIQVPGAIRAASRADVSIDVVDAGGLRPTDDVDSFSRFSRQTDGATDLVSSTGGLAFINSNFFDKAVEDVWQDAGHYYLLGYTAPTPASDVHRITVRVKRSGVQVRVRKYRR